MNYVAERVSNADRARYALGASPNAHQGKNQTIPMFQEQIDELGQKTYPQEAPETIFESQVRGQYPPQTGSLTKEHLEP